MYFASWRLLLRMWYVLCVDVKAEVSLPCVEESYTQHCTCDLLFTAFLHDRRHSHRFQDDPFYLLATISFLAPPSLFLFLCLFRLANNCSSLSNRVCASTRIFSSLRSIESAVSICFCVSFNVMPSATSTGNKLSLVYRVIHSPQHVPNRQPKVHQIGRYLKFRLHSSRASPPTSSGGDTHHHHNQQII